MGHGWRWASRVLGGSPECRSRGSAHVLRSALVACVATVAFLLLVGIAYGEEPVSVEEMSKRRSALRAAAGKYITHRQRFPSRCPACRGTGKQARRKGRSIVRVECKQCVGQGTWLSKDDYREVYYDMRTPAFRMLPGIKDVLGKQYDQARRGHPWPSLIRRYRIAEWELVDPTHGIAWFQFNGSKVPTATYWIFAPDEDGRRSEWFLYDARGDGPWPSIDENAAPAGGGGSGIDPDVWLPLSPEAGRALRTVLGQARVTFRVMDALERDGVLRLVLEPGLDPEDRHPFERIQTDSVRLSRAALADGTPWQRVEAEWRDQWRDAYGRVALRPRWVSALDRAKRASVPWDSLPLAEQAQSVALTGVEHTGWEPVHGGAPQTPPSGRTGPVPARPDEPAAPPPDPQERPPAPAPPTPTAPDTAELPQLTDKARRAGEKAVAQMREYIAAATAAWNEGVLAHQNGSVDLWQEKLSEARAHLTEAQDCWYEELVPEMPGRDEGERDAVANEEFGGIWDEIGKLKSMVSKLSRLK